MSKSAHVKLDKIENSWTLLRYYTGMVENSEVQVAYS